MNKSDERLVEQAKTFRVPRDCDVGMAAMLELCAAHRNEPMELFHTSYVMGFIKGQRAAKNKARRAAK